MAKLLLVSVLSIFHSASFSLPSVFCFLNSCIFCLGSSISCRLQTRTEVGSLNLVSSSTKRELPRRARSSSSSIRRRRVVRGARVWSLSSWACRLCHHQSHLAKKRKRLRMRTQTLTITHSKQYHTIQVKK